MLAQSKWAWRCGPQAWANQGLGVFARAESESIGLKLFEVENIVSNGISLNDLASFLETETGMEVLQKSFTVPVKKGELVWVPHGFFVVPVSVHIVRDRDSEEPASPEEQVDTAYLLALNSFVPAWAEKMDNSAWAGIVALNRAYFEKNKAKTLWVDRSAVFEKFVKAVEKL